MSLSSLIVQRGVASIRDVEEALARQVLYGGDLATNLLETANVIDEAALTAVHAEAVGREAAPARELAVPPPDVLKLVAGSLAVKELVLPIAVEQGSLVVVVAEPLDSETEWRLSSAVAMPVRQRVALGFRVRQALARAFQFPLERRIERLLVRLGAVAPAPEPAVEEPSPTPGLVLPRPPSTQPEPLSGPAEDAPDTFPDAVRDPAPPLAAQPAAAAFIEPTVQVALPARVGAVYPSAVMAAALASQIPPRKKRRGPLTLDVARAELEAAENRDQVLDVFFEYARQYFDYSALFIVHGDIAEGREAFGAGASDVRRVALPLDLPSVLERARRVRAAVAAELAKDGVDATLRADLRREPKGPVLCVPIVVRTRVVALFYADDGEDRIEAEDIKESSQAAALAGQAFERLIVRRKAIGPNASARPAPNDPGAGASPTTSHPPQTLQDPGRPTLPEMGLQPATAPAHEQPMPLTQLRSTQPLVPVTRVAYTDAARAADAPGQVMPSSPPMTAPPTSPHEPPPPAQVAAVRRPQGPPIPREEGPARTPMRSSRPPAPDLDLWRPGDADALTPAAPEVWAPATLRDGRREPDVANPTGDAPSDAWRPDDAVAAPPPAPPPPEVWRPDSLPVPAQAAAPVPVVPQEVGVWVPGMPEPAQPDPVQVASSQPLSAPAAAAAPAFAGGDEESDARALVAEINRQEASTSQPAPGPAHSRVAVSARPPPIAMVPATPLPSVIVDVELEFIDVVDRVVQSSDAAAETELIHLGAQAMPALMARFPGPIVLAPTTSGPLPKVMDCGPLIRVIARQRRVALPFVLPHCDDGDVERRLYATFLLTELHYPEVIDALTRRVIDEEPRIRRVGLAAARILAQTHPRQLVEQCARLAKNRDEVPAKRVAWIRALAEFGQPLAVPILISFLSEPMLLLNNAASEALVHLTKQNFAGDARKWSSWWTSNVARHRVEWLIDALLHDDTSLRRSAAIELAETTGKQFGLADDASRRDRERIHLTFREWWLTEGRQKFVGAM